MDPLISVIVPIYNTEPYLRKCLDSIVSQTYRNLEIILVDDGSPDNCGGICDEYAARDSRITVIHKTNGGLSSARNAGLAAAAGEWIGWVDSDDWIELDMYDHMLKKAVRDGADIVVCGRAEVFPDREIPKSWEEDAVMDRETALASLLEDDEMQNYCCDKLFRAVLWKGITFPEGKTFEDIAVMHRLFIRADKIACLSGRGYNYRQHPGSIVSDKSLENELNYYYATRARYEAMRGDWPQFQDRLLVPCVMCAKGMWTNYYKSPREARRSVQPQLREVSAFCAPYVKKVGAFADVGLAGRIILNLIPYTAWWSFALAGLVSWLYEKKSGRAL